MTNYLAQVVKQNSVKYFLIGFVDLFAPASVDRRQAIAGCATTLREGTIIQSKPLRGITTGLCVCVAALLAVLGDVSESGANTRDMGPCQVGTVLGAGEYCSHKDGDNDFKLTVGDGEACIDFRGSTEAGSSTSGKFSQLKFAAEKGNLSDGTYSGVTARWCSKSEMTIYGFQASSQIALWTVESLPGSTTPVKENESATGDPPPPSPPQQSATQTKEENEESASERSTAPWADPDFPEIDYTRHFGFQEYQEWSSEIFGWWVIGQASNDKATYIAVNVSAVEPTLTIEFERMLRIQCNKDDVAVFLKGGTKDFRIPLFSEPLVTYRFGNSPEADEVWTSSDGFDTVGVSGDKAVHFVRKLLLHETDGLSIGARENAQDKWKKITFSLLGARKMADFMAERCPRAILFSR